MQSFRQSIRAAHTMPEGKALSDMIGASLIDAPLRARIHTRAVDLVERIRSDSNPGMMELFLGEYGMSSDEGVALMCLAEALLRVPDGDTMDALIEDKIAPSQWGTHLGHSNSSLVNASTWALFITGKVLNEGQDASIATTLRGAIKRLGEPLIRQAVARVMKEMGRQFVLGETIDGALKRARVAQSQGYTYSYDMLGEAARTEGDARRYHLAYSDAIGRLARASTSDDIRENPGISIKLSALHPRYEPLQRDRVMDELVPRAKSLATLAKSAGIGLNIDAEEAARLDLSLDVIEAMLSDPQLAGWDGFGVVVQAYGQRAPFVLDWLFELATRLDRRIMVRLVKGAYWDTEIKLAQVEGHAGFPVFTQKPSTDVSYICCAQKLLGMTDRIYPQFATHNAHTVAAILEMAGDRDGFEFQRLHGMGEALHDTVLKHQKTRCRIYAPVGAHKDLLAYLVRRLLENGANSSFVNQIVDETVSPELVAADPFAQVIGFGDVPAHPKIRAPGDLFAPERDNSSGWDLSDPAILARLEQGIATFDDTTWKCGARDGAPITLNNPANGEPVGTAVLATEDEAGKACETVQDWGQVPAPKRAGILRRAATLYEENAFEIFAILMREAGKTLTDCIGELREAVDFLRYYALQGETGHGKPAGIFTCISPWNFPLAIFTGQIAAALATGNGVLAKPAETTPLIASFAVDLLHKAGVPRDVLKLLPGTGAEVGTLLTSHPRVSGVCFTGSTATAQRINRTMARHLDPHAALIAETGGLNAMIVDSTALPEQAITDILTSAFQSAGQRCSALRMLYLQDDIADGFLTMLYGAMDELRLGNPRNFATDIGPVIDRAAQTKIARHIALAEQDGRVLKQLAAPVAGTFIAPTVIRVAGIGDLAEEIFGPVLHVATYRAEDLDQVIDGINATGYGLTFGFHSRIDDRVQQIVDRVQAGNIYVNRNQIGAVVGSQPFGGEGLSGTGPKAGGPHYLPRFRAEEYRSEPEHSGRRISVAEVEAAFANLPEPTRLASEPVELPGPTGESNLLSLHPRDRVLCLGPGADQAREQARIARDIGCRAVAVAPGLADGLDGVLDPADLQQITGLDAVICWGADLRAIRVALAERDGPLVPLLSQTDFTGWLQVERHVCIDTTAAGGNAALLAS